MVSLIRAIFGGVKKKRKRIIIDGCEFLLKEETILIFVHFEMISAVFTELNVVCLFTELRV